MSHYAKVINGIVEQVIVAEADFIAMLSDASSWVQTSYNTRGGIHYGQDGNPDGGVALRGNYAGIGYIYDATNDVFYPPKPYPSWIISESNWNWQPPIAMPNDEKYYVWDEETQSWVSTLIGQ